MNYEYGKLNSLANDNKFTVSQGLDFPTVYSRQSMVYKTGMHLSELQLEGKEIDVRSQVKSYYFRILVLDVLLIFYTGQNAALFHQHSRNEVHL